MGIEIKQKEIKEYRCDYCNILMDFDTIELSFGYPSEFDMESYVFCSDECLKKWVNSKIK